MKILNLRLTQARFVGLALLATGLAGPARADYSSTVISQGPVGYWRLSETTPPHAPITSAATRSFFMRISNKP